MIQSRRRSLSYGWALCSIVGIPAAVISAACGTTSLDTPIGTSAVAEPDASAGAAGAGATSPPITFGGDRPVTVHVPPSYAASAPMPLVILLHGYTSSGDAIEDYMKFTPLADARGFLYAHPDGTTDSFGSRFWFATNACCDLNASRPDDSAYLSGLIDEIKATYNVDAKRVFFIGHSNGGFMSHRMACDHADQVAAIVSIAGAQWLDRARCAPSNAVSALEIHGTSDLTIGYMGGAIGANRYPSAEETASTWAALNGCSGAADTSATPMDLDRGLAGNETTVKKYTSCNPGGHAELWTIAGGRHSPTLSDTFSSRVVDFLFAHAKP